MTLKVTDNQYGQLSSSWHDVKNVILRNGDK